jgi:hypothetical protein
MKIVVYILAVILVLTLLTSCDPFTGQRPYNYPNTRWVSEDPDMFFVVGEEQFTNQWGSFADVTHAQITKDGEVIELICSFAVSGALVLFYDVSGFDSETGKLIHAGSTSDITLFTGLCKFGPDKLVVTIRNNDKGFLDDSITEIVFVREDIEAD